MYNCFKFVEMLRFGNPAPFCIILCNISGNHTYHLL
jgi:hypothetical protein